MKTVRLDEKTKEVLRKELSLILKDSGRAFQQYDITSTRIKKIYDELYHKRYCSYAEYLDSDQCLSMYLIKYFGFTLNTQGLNKAIELRNLFRELDYQRYSLSHSRTAYSEILGTHNISSWQVAKEDDRELGVERLSLFDDVVYSLTLISVVGGNTDSKKEIKLNTHILEDLVDYIQLRLPYGR